jgi:metal-responsive CopG/Arc/MetJ family transcriptional regulator
MIRMDVNLTEKQRSALAALSKATAKSRSQLVREAVDRLIAESAGTIRAAALNAAAGMWRDRDDLPDFAALRREWDRR